MEIVPFSLYHILKVFAAANVQEPFQTEMIDRGQQKC